MAIGSEAVVGRFIPRPFRNLPSPQYGSNETGSTIPLPTAIKVWDQVDLEVRHCLSFHQRFWWTRSGYALAVLLENSEYSRHAQYQSLLFFALVICSSLGAAAEPALGVKPWNSFMTDDGNPIELSWDWHTGTKAPTIRFSIEPVGLVAGTATDPQNWHAASNFHQELLRSLPRTNVEWFDHFKQQLSCSAAAGSSASEGHSSRIFYAFDLAEDGITSKAYFFPGFKAKAIGQTNLTIISQAIVTAPYCSPEKLKALAVLQDFVMDSSTPALEMDMLAIDLVEPTSSRLKIYFRSRETSFSSVKRTMTMGDRLVTSDLVHGLQKLRLLWDALLEQRGRSDDEPLPGIEHRTAGILYYVEFSLGRAVPKVKIYIPVRHYASSDKQTIGGLSDYLYRTNAQSGSFMPAYLHALGDIL